jgi:hypothetical protein
LNGAGPIHLAAPIFRFAADELRLRNVEAKPPFQPIAAFARQDEPGFTQALQASWRALGIG